MKNWKRVLFISGLCVYCAVAVIAIRGDGRVSRAEKNEWKTAAVTATVLEQTAGRSGPGFQYGAEDESILAGEEITALSAAYDERSQTWWIQTEYIRQDEKRRVYTEAVFLDANVSDLPQETVLRDSVIVNRSVYAYSGPGYEYSMYREQIRYGTQGTVWQTENGYAQLEFEDGQTGTVRRVWVPENALEAPNG